MLSDDPLPAMDSINYYLKPVVLRKDGVVNYLLQSLGMFQSRLCVGSGNAGTGELVLKSVWALAQGLNTSICAQLTHA
ncbi:hypothetical protein PoB_002523200 [Plakobranchus ocellatus]|uniref:Uncharacterized protein n=1 Tax=Plakobranchus ocellatus TaxID=259542 RepID=A0AAV3ZVN2_9GAST|nr:hypothetical protein PoB_002523200 [Plakobranchus ocellatus]